MQKQIASVLATNLGRFGNDSVPRCPKGLVLHTLQLTELPLHTWNTCYYNFAVNSLALRLVVLVDIADIGKER